MSQEEMESMTDEALKATAYDLEKELKAKQIEVNKLLSDGKPLGNKFNAIEAELVRRATPQVTVEEPTEPVQDNG